MYTCWGPVRGGCGHAHRTVAGAFACVYRDRIECHERGGYSDRRVRQIMKKYEATNYDTIHGPGKEVDAVNRMLFV
jgi:hypothetical protein